MTTTCRHDCSSREIFPDREELLSVPVRTARVPNACLALVTIAGMEALAGNAARLAELFSPVEVQHIRGFRFAKRRHEWMAGRVAAKAAARSFLGSDRHLPAPSGMTLLADAHGRPEPGPGWPARIGRPSISHSHAHCVAMVSAGACGVDLQRIEERIIGLEKRIIRSVEQKELARQAGLDRAAALTLAWSAKEAVKKMALGDRPGLFEAIVVDRVTPVDGRRWRLRCYLAETGQALAVEAFFMERYILAWCMTGGDNNA